MGIKDVTLAMGKNKVLKISISIDEERQNKALEALKMKPMKKVKRDFQIENYETARYFLAVLNRNYILLNNASLVVNDKITPKDLQ